MNDNHAFKPRIVKVEETGNRYRSQIKLRVRLEGQWLARAGLKANQQVKIENPTPGVLVIQSL